jgi:hypothetical protein
MNITSALHATHIDPGDIKNQVKALTADHQVKSSWGGLRQVHIVTIQDLDRSDFAKISHVFVKGGWKWDKPEELETKARDGLYKRVALDTGKNWSPSLSGRLGKVLKKIFTVNTQQPETKSVLLDRSSNRQFLSAPGKKAALECLSSDYLSKTVENKSGEGKISVIEQFVKDAGQRHHPIFNGKPMFNERQIKDEDFYSGFKALYDAVNKAICNEKESDMVFRNICVLCNQSMIVDMHADLSNHFDNMLFGPEFQEGFDRIKFVSNPNKQEASTSYIIDVDEKKAKLSIPVYYQVHKDTETIKGYIATKREIIVNIDDLKQDYSLPENKSKEIPSLKVQNTLSVMHEKLKDAAASLNNAPIARAPVMVKV